jgi:hypothetical protein
MQTLSRPNRVVASWRTNHQMKQSVQGTDDTILVKGRCHSRLGS